MGGAAPARDRGGDILRTSLALYGQMALSSVPDGKGCQVGGTKSYGESFSGC